MYNCTFPLSTNPRIVRITNEHHHVNKDMNAMTLQCSCAGFILKYFEMRSIYDKYVRTRVIIQLHMYMQK